MSEPKRYLKFVGGSSDDHSGYWFDALGWMASFFAQLEGVSYSVVEKLAPPVEVGTLLKLSFRKRNIAASKLLQAHLAEQPALASEWSDFFARVMSAAPRRNHFMHNPLTVNLKEMQKGIGPEHGIILIHEPGRPVIGIREVQDYVEELRSLNYIMLDLLERTTF